MIGQIENIRKIDKCIKELPQFILIQGDSGCGKTELSKYICNKLNAKFIYCDTKISTIRDIIKLSYKQIEPEVYFIPHADKMSNGAKNSLLKIIEEPPANSYFLITVENLNNVLETWISRASIIKMSPYTHSELKEYINKCIDKKVSEEDINRLLFYFNSPGQILRAVEYDMYAFYDFVKLTAENIHIVNGSNAFKLANKLNLKKDAKDGYDIDLFLTAYKLQILTTDLTTHDIIQCIKITNDCLHDLNNKSINRQMLIDNWVLRIRKVFI